MKRLQLDYVDLVFCHRPDPDTPIEETVWAMHDMIERGKALYWGTSEWSAQEIRAAWEIADKHHLRKPVMEQPQYNLFHRKRVEQEYARLVEDIGLGLTTWSPLASGLLTGKYRQGVPADSRGALESYGFLRDGLVDPAKNKVVGELEAVAKDLGCTLAQLSLAWCLKNPRVSTVITGATRAAQVAENMKAVDVAMKLDGETMARIERQIGARRAKADIDAAHRSPGGVARVGHQHIQLMVAVPAPGDELPPGGLGQLSTLDAVKHVAMAAFLQHEHQTGLCVSAGDELRLDFHPAVGRRVARQGVHLAVLCVGCEVQRQSAEDQESDHDGGDGNGQCGPGTRGSGIVRQTCGELSVGKRQRADLEDHQHDREHRQQRPLSKGRILAVQHLDRAIEQPRPQRDHDRQSPAIAA